MRKTESEGDFEEVPFSSTWNQVLREKRVGDRTDSLGTLRKICNNCSRGKEQQYDLILRIIEVH